MNSLVLAAYVAIGTPDGHTLPDEDAPRWAAKALYKQMEWDQYVNRLEERYLSKDLKKYGGYGILVVQLATQRRFSHTWRF